MHNILQFSPQLTALEFFSGIGLARAGMAKANRFIIWIFLWILDIKIQINNSFLDRKSVV